MAREPRSARVDFRVQPSQRERWQQAADRLGVHEISDFYRDAIDSMADAVLGTQLPKSPAAVAATRARPLSKKEQASGRRDR